jgi:hypothetical protein
MGLSFEGAVICQSNLIRARKKDTVITRLTSKFAYEV